MILCPFNQKSKCSLLKPLAPSGQSRTWRRPAGCAPSPSLHRLLAAFWAGSNEIHKRGIWICFTPSNGLCPEVPDEFRRVPEFPAFVRELATPKHGCTLAAHPQDSSQDSSLDSSLDCSLDSRRRTSQPSGSRWASPAQPAAMPCSASAARSSSDPWGSCRRASTMSRTPVLARKRLARSTLALS